MDKVHFNLPEKFPAKEIFFLFFTIVAWLIFRNPLNDFFAKNVLSVIFPGELQASERWGLGLLAVLVLLLFIYLHQRQYTIKKNTLIKLLPLFVFYLFERVCYDDFTFFKLWAGSPFAFADIFLIEIVAGGLRLLETKTTPKEEKERNYEEAIRNISHDDLKRFPIAEELVKSICEKECNFMGSLAVGIIGPWGSGKTSFLFFITEAIKQKPAKLPILINFKPWLVDGESEIIKEFFRTLKFELLEYSDEFSSSINEYVKLISKASKNQYLEAVVEFFDKKDEPAWHAKEKLKNVIEKLNRPIYIFIDDMDRLTPNEILQVLKIIRSTGSFSNITYFVAFDMEYVLASLGELKIHNPEDYLQKIFPTERHLPAIGRKKIREYIVERFNAHLTDEQFNDFRRQAQLLVNTDFYEESSFIDRHITNYREVNNLVNCFVQNSFELIGEVNFLDFLFSMVILIENSRLYNLLALRGDYLTIRENSTSLELAFANEKYEIGEVCSKAGVPYSIKWEKTLIQKFRSETEEDTGKKPEEVLPDQPHKEGSKSERGFANRFPINEEKYFDRYFNLKLVDGEIPEKEFLSFLKNSFINNKALISAWKKKGLLRYVILKCRGISGLSEENWVEFLKSYLWVVSELEGNQLRDGAKIIFRDIVFDGLNFRPDRPKALTIFNKIVPPVFNCDEIPKHVRLSYAINLTDIDAKNEALNEIITKLEQELAE